MTFEPAPRRPVYIVDDDAAFRRAVERLMRSVGVTAVSFESGPAFLKAAPDLADGCVILDVRMPGMGGLELQKQLKLIGFKLPIIVMTLKGDMETAVRAMKGGAVDFIEKPFDDEKLLDAINEAMAMETAPVHDREGMEAAKRIARLSPRERQVLDKLVAGRLTKQIAYDLGISARTVEVHRARMFARLGTRTPAEAVRLAVLAQLTHVHDGSPAADPPGKVVSRALPK
ncbi:two-component system response regulator FixJ [Bradyrhizobium sp. I1.8.5]|uniref:response regulator transcription factor n=1 Tax=Bradyrhizobium sp. I1.8.5 TaxID=3156365 RepID=UPI003394DC9C